MVTTMASTWLTNQRLVKSKPQKLSSFCNNCRKKPLNFCSASYNFVSEELTGRLSCKVFVNPRPMTEGSNCCTFAALLVRGRQNWCGVGPWDKGILTPTPSGGRQNYVFYRINQWLILTPTPSGGRQNCFLVMPLLASIRKRHSEHQLTRG
jgi:hypothetical protein